ncbi:deoxyribose-phosphate aldolase [Desulfohalovibrio reitneri]|uniref:deoxyribose-phosphate aldolase n=1 Tax=Desulfohalovibrio reitneri TaxID=1307759 RepID=UPI000556A919|nr:deoxyribose-phosphate aldolase [Desulfohalovibrio reitneri]
MEQPDVTRAALAARIDHTLLDEATPEEAIRRLCEEAADFGCAGVCVYSAQVGLAARLLEGTEVIPVAVAGFPSGLDETRGKAAEARRAVAMGAREVDMVVNRDLLAARRHHDFLADVAAVVQAAAPWPVKAILETAALDAEDKAAASALALAAGAAFLKTSTGFGPGGATVEDVALLRRMAGGRARVKASGGIKTFEQAVAMVRAGADRLGCSATGDILAGAD